MRSVSRRDMGDEVKVDSICQVEFRGGFKSMCVYCTLAYVSYLFFAFLAAL